MCEHDKGAWASCGRLLARSDCRMQLPTAHRGHLAGALQDDYVVPREDSTGTACDDLWGSVGREVRGQHQASQTVVHVRGEVVNFMSHTLVEDGYTYFV